MTGWFPEPVHAGVPVSVSDLRPLPPGIARVVESGLCIGCGLCEAIPGRERMRMVMTPEGRERPVATGVVDDATERRILAVCPGVRQRAPAPLAAPGFRFDEIWGNAATLAHGWAADPEMRFRAATGGVLSALALHLLDSGEVDFVAHVRADEERPTRWRASVSRTRDEVLAACGSRYGPAAPLVDLPALLDGGRPFAFVGKPCDLGALANLAREDPRVDALVRYRLCMVCGGASELRLTTEVLASWGITEADVRLLRHRGHGNPGPMHVETHDGRVFECAYNDIWADEANWKLQFRCKVCPDPIGEQADVAACDVWPGGGPTGEDEGFNGIIARTPRGEALVHAAVDAGHLVLGEPFGFRDLDDFQPHQVAKRRALSARLAALMAAGAAEFHFEGFRLDAQARALGLDSGLEQFEGTLRRLREGRVSEPAPRPEAG